MCLIGIRGYNTHKPSIESRLLMPVTSYLYALRPKQGDDPRVLESGDIVQTVLIIALLVVIVVAVFSSLTPAVTGQGREIANCIANAHRGFSACNF